MEMMGLEIGFHEALEVLQQDGFERSHIGHANGQKYVWLKKFTHKHTQDPYERALHQAILLVDTKDGIQWYVYPETIIAREYYGFIGAMTGPPFGHTDYIVKHSYA